MRKFRILLITATITILLSSGALAQPTFFTYQGNLVLNGQPATGNYDFEFLLFDSLSGGTQIDITNVRPNLAVSDGIFTTTLAFQDAQESTADRYLEIRVRPVGGNSYTTLTPRTWMTSAPTAVKSWYSHQAGTAQNALSLGGVAANQYVLTGDGRLSDARNPLPNSANYIQNRTTQQASSNFSISGTGTGNVLNALTQFNIGGQRVLAAPASSNTYVGLNSGQNNSAGFSNTFVGTFAGQTNTGGDENSFFGKDAGISSTGNQNTFIGTDAGQSNTTGSGNSALGAGANVSSGTLTNATAIGAGAVVTFSDTIQLGRDTLDSVRIGRLGSNGITAVCLNGVNGFATCSSSARYKYNINDYRSGSGLLNKLRPVTFNWTAGNALDLGLVAEEVAAIDPLLVTYNDKGEVEGVKYDRIGVVLINTVKEQQSRIEHFERELAELKKLIADKFKEEKR